MKKLQIQNKSLDQQKRIQMINFPKRPLINLSFRIIHIQSNYLKKDNFQLKLLLNYQMIHINFLEKY